MILYDWLTNATGAVCTERRCTSGDWCSSKRPHHTSVASAAMATCAAARRLQGHRVGLPVFDWPSPGLPCRRVPPGVRLWWSPAAFRQHSDRSFSVAGARLWNAVPSTLWQTDASFDCFKRLLKIHLFSRIYYTHCQPNAEKYIIS